MTTLLITTANSEMLSDKGTPQPIDTYFLVDVMIGRITLMQRMMALLRTFGK